MPQEVSLFEGTIAQNIARFETNAKDEDILEAAKLAGVHNLIISFPEGYSKQIGENGAYLSAGQRQRIALARAVYGNPFLMVLDEPNANLDSEGEAALTAAISYLRGRGCIVIVISHRASSLSALDKIMILAKGKILAFGPRDEVLTAIAPKESPNDRPHTQAN